MKQILDLTNAHAVLKLAHVTCNGWRLAGCVEADEESGIAVCIKEDGTPFVQSDRPDVGYRMCEVAGTVKIH